MHRLVLYRTTPYAATPSTRLTTHLAWKAYQSLCSTLAWKALHSLCYTLALKAHQKPLLYAGIEGPHRPLLTTPPYIQPLLRWGTMPMMTFSFIWAMLRLYIYDKLSPRWHAKVDITSPRHVAGRKVLEPIPGIASRSCVEAAVDRHMYRISADLEDVCFQASLASSSIGHCWHLVP